MKKIIFWFFFLCWILLLLYYLQNIKKEETLTSQVSADVTSDAKKWEISYTGHTKVPYKREEAFSILSDISNTLGIRVDFKDYRYEKNQNGFSVFYDVSGSFWRCKISYYQVEQLGQGYLSVRLCMEDHIKKASVYEESIRQIKEKYELDGMVLLMYGYDYPLLSKEDKEEKINKIYQNLQAGELENHVEGQYIFSYGLSEKIQDKLFYSDKKVNVNVMVMDDYDENKSYVYLGLPYLPLDQ